jgi:sn-glycerol 3-phosphate transport system substrate-binding protein
MVKNDGGPLYTSIDAAIAGRTEILGHPVVRDVVSSADRYFTIEDGWTAMCPLSSTTLMYANLTLLEAAGVAAVPRTWDELDAACRAVTQLSGGPSHAITWVNHGWMFQQAVAAQGGLLTDHDNGRTGRAERVELGSEEMLAFVSWWQRLHKDGYYLYTGTQMDWVGAFGAFAEQQTAFLFTSSVDASRLVQEGRNRGFAVRACRLPYNGEVPYAGNVLGGDGIFMAAGLDKATEDGALAFLQYLNNPTNAIDRHKRTNYMPITESCIRRLDEDGWFVENPHRYAAVEQLAAGDDSPAALGALVGNFAGIQDVMSEAMHDVLVHGADPVARFRQGTVEAQRLLDHYNAACDGQIPGTRGPDTFRVH